MYSKYSVFYERKRYFIQYIYLTGSKMNFLHRNIQLSMALLKEPLYKVPFQDSKCLTIHPKTYNINIMNNRFTLYCNHLVVWSGKFLCKDSQNNLIYFSYLKRFEIYSFNFFFFLLMSLKIYFDKTNPASYMYICTYFSKL